jgi:hypothetical protein
MRDGRAIAVKRVLATGQETREVVAQVLPSSPEKLRALLDRAAQIHPGELVDENPGEPGCADAPVTEYVVRARDGARVVVARDSACKHYALGDSTAYDIRGLLEALRTLSVTLDQ